MEPIENQPLFDEPIKSYPEKEIQILQSFSLLYL